MLLHDAVEGVSPVAFAADGEVEAEGGECAFLVVADDGVGAVFVLFVEFVPSGEAGFGKALFQTAFGLLNAGDALGEQAQVGFGGDGAASGEEEVVVVGSDAFKRPELLGVVFAVEVVGGEGSGFDGFDVPSVEVFV